MPRLTRFAARARACGAHLLLRGTPVEGGGERDLLAEVVQRAARGLERHGAAPLVVAAVDLGDRARVPQRVVLPRRGVEVEERRRQVRRAQVVDLDVAAQEDPGVVVLPKVERAGTQVGVLHAPLAHQVHGARRVHDRERQPPLAGHRQLVRGAVVGGRGTQRGGGRGGRRGGGAMRRTTTTIVSWIKLKPSTHRRMPTTPRPRSVCVWGARAQEWT